MAIDPRLFLGIGGPTPQQQMLPPGFRPPGPGPGAPMMSPPQMQMPQFGIPGMGLRGPRKPEGWVPSTSGGEEGRTAGDADLAGYGGSPVDPMSGNPNADPTIYETGATSPGGFSTWWARNFGGLGRLF